MRADWTSRLGIECFRRFRVRGRWPDRHWVWLLADCSAATGNVEERWEWGLPGLDRGVEELFGWLGLDLVSAEQS